MEFIKFIGIIILAEILFIPIDKKIRLRSKYRNELNKRFRLTVVILGLSVIAISIIIAFLSDDYLHYFGVSRDLIHDILTIPLLFLLMIVLPSNKDK